MQSAAASIPSPLLSQAAAQLTLEEVTALAHSQQGHPLQLRDVAPSADLWALFSRWEGQFAVQGPGSDGTATVRFSNAAARSDAAAAFGGGLRGLFRVDTSAPLQGGLPTACAIQTACPALMHS